MSELISLGRLRSKSVSYEMQKIVKSYVAVFVCFSSKAIHLELVSDLTTDAFMASLKRFIARRVLFAQPFTAIMDKILWGK